MYLRYLCCPTPGTRGRSSLRLMEQGLLFVPYARTSTSQARAFSAVGPSVWNGLPLAQRLLPRILSDTFYSSVQGSGALLSIATLKRRYINLRNGRMKTNRHLL